MAKFKNISPLGALDVPLLDRVVQAGEVVTVNKAQAASLAGQKDTWEPVTTAGSASDGEGNQA